MVEVDTVTAVVAALATCPRSPRWSTATSAPRSTCSSTLHRRVRGLTGTRSRRPSAQQPCPVSPTVAGRARRPDRRAATGCRTRLAPRTARSVRTTSGPCSTTSTGWRGPGTRPPSASSAGCRGSSRSWSPTPSGRAALGSRATTRPRSATRWSVRSSTWVTSTPPARRLFSWVPTRTRSAAATAPPSSTSSAAPQFVDKGQVTLSSRQPSRTARGGAGQGDQDAAAGGREAAQGRP